MAQERADTAVVSALVPFCVFKAQQDPDQGPLIKFQAEQSFYYRFYMVSKTSWATLGSDKFANNTLVRARSDKLHTMKMRLLYFRTDHTRPG